MENCKNCVYALWGKWQGQGDFFARRYGECKAPLPNKIPACCDIDRVQIIHYKLNNSLFPHFEKCQAWKGKINETS